MNTDLIRYKYRTLTFILLLSYAYLHVTLTGVYEQVTLNDLISLNTHLPYAQRVLVPLLGHGLQYLMPIAPKYIFFILEIVFSLLLFCTLNATLKLFFNERQAYAWTLLFFLLLPLITVIN